MDKAERKRKKEIASMNLILAIYLKGHPDEKEEVEVLRTYALQRIERCPMMETKTYCSVCHIHCYHPEYREKMKKIMRYAGPKLLWRRPLQVLDHGWKALVAKLRRK